MTKVPEGIIEKLRGVKERIKSNEGGSNFYKARDGKATVRLLPGLGKNPDLFYRERGVHWDVGPNNEKVVCPNVTDDAGAPCAVCEVVAILFQGTDEDKALARAMRVKREYMFNIVDRDQMDKGVQVWTAPPTVMQLIATYVEDPDFGAIWDPIDGTDFIVSRQKKGKMTDYKESYFKRKASMLAEDEKAMADLLGSAADLYGIEGMIPTYEETKQALYGDEEKSDAATSVETEEPEERPEPVKPELAKPAPEEPAGGNIEDTIRARLDNLRKGK